MRTTVTMLIAFTTLFGFLFFNTKIHDRNDLNRQVELHECDHGVIEVVVDRYTSRDDLNQACFYSIK